MKKSFMTRALATGLSFAMAFSLSAATNVTTASAAAKKASVTTFMKVDSKSVTEGKKVTTYMNSTAAKKYRIKKHTETATTKKYISVTMTDSRKGLTIQAKDGAVTAAKLQKKGVYTTIYFAPAKSVAAVKKASATKYVKLKVVVNAKPEAKLTMTAAATGVKKITVSFNKAVDTATTKIVVKKGAATPTITSTTFAADGKSADIVMGTKLTEGTYTVDATVGTEVLSTEIAVQNEKLTSFALVGAYLIADPTSKSAATISYKALNQYDEMMPADRVSATCSFGKIEDGDNHTPTADKAGTIKVTSIPDVLAVPNGTGTIVLVDTATGVTLNETVTYQTKAVASKATVYGIYNTKTEKLIEGNLKTGDTIADYKILVNVQNQYDSDMTPSGIVKSDCNVTYNAASVLTDVQVDGTVVVDNLTEISYDGKSCFLIPLKVKTGTKIADAGTLSLTMVSANKGVIASPSFTIDTATVIQTLTISAKDTVYANQENELIVEAIDTNGNAVTKYDALSTIDYPEVDGVTLKKNSDGTGTFYYNPGSMAGSSSDKWKKSDLKTLIFKANPAASGNYIVKTVNVTVYANREGWKVSGTTTDTVTATNAGGKLKFKLDSLTYEDQYANTLKFSDKQVSGAAISGYLVSKDEVFVGYDATGSAITWTDNKYIELTAANKKGTATLYLKYMNSEDNKTANTERYDIKVTLSVVDVASVVASDLKVTVNNGKTIYGAPKAKLINAIENKVAPATPTAVNTDEMEVTVVVTGSLNGKTVVIPESQFTIVEGKELGGYNKIGTNYPEKTEEKTVTVIVDSTEGPQEVSTKVTVSNKTPVPTVLKAASDKTIKTVSGSAAVTNGALYSTIVVEDQYGVQMKDKYDSTLYTITFTGSNADVAKVSKNATNVPVISLPAKADGSKATYTANVKFKLNGIEYSQDITIEVSGS